MRVVLDTNVLISGIFFLGPPFEILKAWRDGDLQFVLSPQILDEYCRVAKLLRGRFPNIEIDPVLTLIATNSDMIEAPDLPSRVCDDADDDKFLACALASNSKFIISGDKHLLRQSGYRGISVLSPSAFVQQYLRDTQ